MAVGSTDVDIQNLKGAIKLGQQTLKSLEFANGGAVVAILSFYGNVASRSGYVPIDRAEISRALVVFASGLAVALVAAVLAYLGQLFVATSEPNSPTDSPDFRSRRLRHSNQLLTAAIICALLSTGLFVTGVVCASHAFK